MTGKNFLDALGANVAALFSRLVESMFGPRADAVVVGNTTWADLGATIGLLLLVLVLHGLLASFFRRKSRRKEDTAETRSWRSQVFVSVSKPLYLLIWIYGGYVGAIPLLPKMRTGEAAHPLELLAEKALDLGVFIVVFWMFFRFTRVIELRLQQWAAKSASKWDDIFVPLLGKTARVIIPVIAVILALPVAGLPPAFSGLVGKASSLLIIGAVSWVLFQTINSVEKFVLSKYDISVADNLQARKVYTQVGVITKTVYVIIGIFTVASALMLFDEVRRFGTSILASAGVIGIIVGFAAQRTIANLFAGFQLAMTQPIRLDDVVIVEGEWGRIEEITLTYVVVHIWDDRRLVVPLSCFIEKPFQNWTRVSANLLGSVFVWADYSLPVAELRREVKAIVESCKDWDRRFWNLQVTDATERTMQIRVLATAADSGKAWDLRCEIREKLIGLIQRSYPHSLPRLRAELDGRQRGEIPEAAAPGPD